MKNYPTNFPIEAILMGENHPSLSNHFLPWYNANADYQTNALSYYDYLADTNQILVLIEKLINKLSLRNIEFSESNSISMSVEGDWQKGDDIIKVISNLKKSLKTKKYINDGLEIELINAIELLEDGVYTPDYKKVIDYIMDSIKESKKPYLPFNIYKQKFYKSIDLYDPTGKEFVQGVAYNQEKNEMYVSRQVSGSKKITIYRYNLETTELIDFKSYETSGGPYGEGLCYFYNAVNELCFVVKTQYEKGTCIFNYATGSLSNRFDMEGNFKMSLDNNNKYLISAFGDATRTYGVYIYDFETVKVKEPKLLKTIYFNLDIPQGNKVQGLTMIDNVIYLACGGGEFNYPSVKAVSLSGDVLASFDLDKIDLRKQIDGKKEDYRYESEGVSFIKYAGYYVPVFNHVLTDTGKLFLFMAGDTTFDEIKLSTENNISVTNSQLWHDLPLSEGVTAYGSDSTPQYMLDDKGFVHLRGTCTHKYISTNPELVLGTLPYMFIPQNNSFFTTPATVSSEHPSASNRIVARFNGEIILSMTNAHTTNKQFTCLDGINFPTRRGVN